MSRLGRFGFATLAAALVGTACGSNSANHSGPASVGFKGDRYRVSCTRVPDPLLGRVVDVTYEPEEKWGSPYAVESRTIVGVDLRDALALNFVEAYCEEIGGGWIVGVAAHVAGSDPARVESIMRLLEQNQ